MDRRGFGDLQDDALRDAWPRTQARADCRPPIRIADRIRRDVHAHPDVGSREELCDDQLDHPVVDQAHQSELFGDRHHRGCRHDTAIGSSYAHEAFVEGNLTARGRDHRLESNQDAPLVERRDNLVGRADIFLT